MLELWVWKERPTNYWASSIELGYLYIYLRDWFCFPTVPRSYMTIGSSLGNFYRSIIIVFPLETLFFAYLNKRRITYRLLGQFMFQFVADFSSVFSVWSSCFWIWSRKTVHVPYINSIIVIIIRRTPTIIFKNHS
jgi:hypothetical protein